MSSKKHIDGCVCPYCKPITSKPGPNEHAGCAETKRYIAEWEPGSLTVSRRLLWGRFGLLGIMGDYILRYLPSGNIAEIGVGESSLFLTELARRHSRRVYHCDRSPGEIKNCQSVEGFFDPGNVVFTGTSDDFFKEIMITKLALGFIDGDHNYEFVKRDFDNMLSLMMDEGLIFIHDMYPPTEEYLSEHRCGDGYRLRQQLEQRSDLDVFTFPFGAMGVGLTMVRKLPKDLPYYRWSGKRKCDHLKASDTDRFCPDCMHHIG